MGYRQIWGPDSMRHAQEFFCHRYHGRTEGLCDVCREHLREANATADGEVARLIEER